MCFIMKDQFTHFLLLHFINSLNKLGNNFILVINLVQLRIAKTVNVMKTLLKIALKFVFLFK